MEPVAALADLVLRRRHSPCAEVAATLPAHVAGEAPLDPRVEAHVAQCLRCQAEIVRYRRMLRTLHALRDDTPEPPSTVLADILTRVGADEAEGRRLLGAAVIIAVAAGAAGGAGVILWLTQRRQPGLRPA